jgi:hypothetical protein
MVRHMSPRLIKHVVFALVAAQLVLSGPVASALAAPPTEQQSTHCADMAPVAGEPDSCPCCPEGIAGMAGCLSACMAVSASSSISIANIHRATSSPSTETLVHLTSLSDPPLKPPPIV